MDSASSSSARRSTASVMAFLTVLMRPSGGKGSCCDSDPSLYRRIEALSRTGRSAITWRRVGGGRDFPPSLKASEFYSERFASRLRLADRQVNGEEGAAVRTVLRPDAAAVLRDDAVRDGEPEAAALTRLLRGEERIEDAREVLGWNTVAVVGDLDAHAGFHERGADREQPAAVRLHHRVLRVLDHVQQHFLQVIVIRPDVGERLQVGAHRDTLGLEARFLEGHDFPDLLRDLAARPPGRAMLREEDEVAHDGGGALGGGIDDAQRFLNLATHRPLTQQVKLRHDDGERVVDLVRHARSQSVDGSQPLRLDHLDLGTAEVV